MARYIDADAVIAKIKAEHCDKCKFSESCYYCDFDEALLLLEEADDADVEEVCRCIDCVYWDGRGYDGRCEAPKNGLIRDYTNYDDFCSYGERKEK